MLADSNKAIKLMETSHPPTYYIPKNDVVFDFLRPNAHQTYCEFKGKAAYLDWVKNDQVIKNVGWHYPSPRKGYEALADHFVFYASKLDQCLVNDEIATAQDGDFYGGWITSNIKGPFKGAPGTWGW